MAVSKSIFPSTLSLLKRLGASWKLCSLFLLVVLFLSVPHANAQDDRPSKAKKEKIRSSRRKGERTRRNPRVRETRFKMRSKQGDRSVNRDLTGRRVRRNQKSPRPRTNFSNYKPPSRRSSARTKSRSTYAPQRIRTASRKGEQSQRGDVSGRRIKTSRSPRPSGSRFSARNPFVEKRSKPSEGRKTYRSTYVRSVSGQKRGNPPYMSAPNPYVAKSKKSREGRNRYSSPSVRSRTARDGRSRAARTGKGTKTPRTASGGTSLGRRGAKSPRTTTGGATQARRSSGGVRTTRTQPGSRAKSFKRGPVKTISGNIRNKRPTNPYAAANTRSKRKGDVARNRDITGRKIRANKNSPRQRVTVNAPNPYRSRNEKRGRKTYDNKGQLARNAKTSKPGGRFSKTTFGGVRTATRAGETSTAKSASGKSLRTKNMSSGRPYAGRPNYPGYLSVSKRGEGGFSGKARRVRSSAKPGERAGVQGGGFKTITARGERSTNRDIAGRRIRTKNRESRTTQIVGRQVKRNLSVSGQPRNNNGRAIAGKKPGKGSIQGGTFGGNLRAKKSTADQGSKYGGGIKSRKPAPGGGSITRLRNNNGRALAAKRPGRGTIQGGNFKGRQRGKPGFYSPEKTYALQYQKGRLHNNKGRALGSRKVSVQGANYQGNLRRRKIQPDEGASYRGRLSRRSTKPSRDAIAGSRYSGNLRKGPATKPGKGTIQGGNFRGRIRTNKGFYSPEKSYAIRTQLDERLHNNRGKALGSVPAGRGTIQGGRYQGTLRAKRNLKPGKGTIAGYKNRGNLRASRNLKPGKGTIAGYKNRGNLRASRNLKPGKGTIAGYKNRGNLRASRNLKPGKGTIAGYRYRGNMRMGRENQHQKAGDALKDSRSWYQIGAIRAHNYKGYYRYRPASRKDQHISSSFTGFNPGNAKKENERFFKFKIWFARLFRNETPRHMRNKGRKPRYDKGESEIWFR